MARKKNQGRRYETDEWLEFMIEGEIESQRQSVRYGEHEVAAECYEMVEKVDVDDIEISGDLEKVKDAFERDVEKAVKEWGGQYRFREGVDEDDIMEAGGAYDVYTALDGSGAGGINDGEWDQYFTDSAYVGAEGLTDFLKERVGKYVDDSGGGDIPNEMSNAVYLKFEEVCAAREENPSPEEKERRRQRAARAEKAKAKRRKKRGGRSRSKNPGTVLLSVGDLVRELKF